MATYNVHAGHNSYATGASKYLNELREDRIVKDYVISYLRSDGHTVYDCTDDNGGNVNQNLYNIVAKCNQHRVDLDVSIHLNAGGGSGVEVWNYDGRTAGISSRICSKVSGVLGIPNRGTKYNSYYYVLANTSSLALLVECAFVDSRSDYNHWNAQACGKAIAEGIVGHSIGGGVPKPTPTPTPTSGITVEYQAHASGKWWGNVKNYNTYNSDGYAGVIGRPLTALMANTIGKAEQVGKLQYRLHATGGGWFGWHTDREKDNAGDIFAGDMSSTCDMLQMNLVGAKGYQVEYRVYSAGKWWEWVRSYNNSNTNGYAGVTGYNIEAVQIRIVK